MGTWHVNGIPALLPGASNGAPILCIHGAGGTALAWAGARELPPKAAVWVDVLADRLRQVAERRGDRRDRRGAGLRGGTQGRVAPPPGPDPQMLTGNGAAILAELEREWWLQADAAALATIEQPALLVAAADSPPEFHEPIEARAQALPNARTVLVGGGHLIDRPRRTVIAFIEEKLEAGSARTDVSSARDRDLARVRRAGARTTARSLSPTESGSARPSDRAPDEKNGDGRLSRRDPRRSRELRRSRPPEHDQHSRCRGHAGLPVSADETTD